MAVLSATTKGILAGKATKGVAKRPGLRGAGARAAAPAGKLGLRVGKPVAKHQARQRIERIGEAARSFGEALATYGPQAAEEFGLVEPPKPKRTAPRVAAGIVIGAGAVYFLEPEHGREHREKVLRLVA